MLRLQIPEHSWARLSEAALEDGLPHRVHVHVQVQVLDSAHVELHEDVALVRGEDLFHVDAHLSIAAGREPTSGQATVGKAREAIGHLREPARSKLAIAIPSLEQGFEHSSALLDPAQH